MESHQELAKGGVMAIGKEYRGTVLVAGATGRTGSWVVRRLLHYGIPVRVMSRSAQKARELFGDKVEVVIGKVHIIRQAI